MQPFMFDVLQQKHHYISVVLRLETVVPQSSCGAEVRARFHALDNRDVWNLVSISFLSDGIRY